MEKTIGQIAYEAYAAAVGGKWPEFGEFIPQYETQRADIKSAWEAAADAVAAHVGRADAGSATTGVRHA